MITNLIAPIARKEEALKGISRSRFSFHFNTARKRRWLLVQFVTAPALPTEDQPEEFATFALAAPRRERNDYNHLIERFQATSMAARCI